MATSMRLVGSFVFMMTILIAATAETYNVGDSLGWNIPPLGDVAYRTWARQQDFRLGDTIVFNWNGTHTVARVSKEDYDNCNGSNSIGAVQAVSPANFTVDTNGSQYFICTVAGHCGLGQKVTITVGGDGSSASSRTTTTMSAIFLAMVIPFMSLI